MSERSKTFAERYAAHYISNAIVVPVGAVFYATGGWWAVLAFSLFSLLVGIALTVFAAWREARS